MADKDDEQQAAFAKIVNKLLKKLPGADPELKGDRAAVHVSRVPDVPHGRGPQPPTGRERFAVWGRVGLGLVVAGMVSQWPYGLECGASLFFYMTALITVMVAGLWASVSAWHRRMGLAHSIALVVVAWGALLTADRILPRVGYAAVQASWRCEQAAGKV